MSYKDAMYDEQQPWGDIPTPKGEQLTYVKKGVLYVEKKPYYIVELIKEMDVSYVSVYAVHPDTDSAPQKLAREVTVQGTSFSPHTRLGQIANALSPVKKGRKWLPRDPVFVAPVIPNQMATLTGKREDGFYERVPDREAVEGGVRKMVRGQNTGVFIGLSSIEWEDKYSIPTESLLEALTQYREELFFDLTGDNSSDSNPLARYYKDKL